MIISVLSAKDIEFETVLGIVKVDCFVLKQGFEHQHLSKNFQCDVGQLE